MSTSTANRINETAEIQEEKTALPRTYAPAKRKKRFKDRKEGRLLRTINAMNKFMPFIMPMRCDAQNTFAETLDVTRADAFIKDMIAAGYENFSFLHVMLAAYVRTVSQKPGINRFVSGQRIYARNNIEVVMTIKKEMTMESPETCIKVYFEPDDTIEEIYDKFNAVVAKEKANAELGSDFDKTANTLASLPRPIIRAVVRILNWMDYHGWLPKFLTGVSPFHGSMIITSMGSLGIKPIYHHIYNFGNLPIFVAYGIKRTVKEPQADGTTRTRRLIDLKVVTDERICDGYYFASAFKLMRRYAENPSLLQKRPEEVFEDID